MINLLVSIFSIRLDNIQNITGVKLSIAILSRNRKLLDSSPRNCAILLWWKLIKLCCRIRRFFPRISVRVFCKKLCLSLKSVELHRIRSFLIKGSRRRIWRFTLFKKVVQSSIWIICRAMVLKRVIQLRFLLLGIHLDILAFLRIRQDRSMRVVWNLQHF